MSPLGIHIHILTLLKLNFQVQNELIVRMGRFIKDFKLMRRVGQSGRLEN